MRARLAAILITLGLGLPLGAQAIELGLKGGATFRLFFNALHTSK